MNTKTLSIVLGLLATCSLAVPALAAGDRTIHWSGNVDDKTIVRIHGDHVITRTITGNQTTNVNVDVERPLPVDRPVHVWLSDVQGRGTVQVVREPGPDNDYTAVIRIYDPQAGASSYSFNLHWNGRNHL